MWSSGGLCSDSAPDLSPLIAASGAPRLPQLSKLCLPSHRVVYCADRFQLKLDRALTATRLQLIDSYSAQLTSLSVAVSSSLTIWIRLLLGRCRHLEQLCLTWAPLRHRRREPPLELQSEPEPADVNLSLPRLHRLEFVSLPLSNGSLLWLLSRCPELTVCSLSDLPYLTKTGADAPFRCCRKLNM